MPNIPVYLEKQDIGPFMRVLSESFDFAFVVETPEKGVNCKKGEKYWRATRGVSEFSDSSYTLWIIGSGPLLRPNPKLRGPDYLEVEDPFGGWCAHPYTNNEEVPGMGDTSRVVVLNLSTTSVRFPGMLGLSDFSWVGSRYEKPHDSAKIFWKGLQAMLKKTGKSVLGDGITSDAGSRFLALPCAYARIAESSPDRVKI
jgi:hypothetical protein